MRSVVARVAQSRRYRWVAPAVVERLAREEIPKSKDLAEAEKRTKRRLHQIVGAYAGAPDYARLLLDLTAAWQGAPDDAFRERCRAAMAGHASTRERLPILDAFYERILAVTGVPNSVVDIACGLNPLAAPWLRLPPGARYLASDLDVMLVHTVAGFLELIGLEGRAKARDVVADPPDDAADLGLLLKSVPCLDQQHPDAAARVLRALRARHLVVSFPTRSLGGHGKGMARTYRARFDALLAELGAGYMPLAEIDLPGELAFVLSAEC